MLIEMLSAATSPNSSQGKHTPIEISGVLYHVRNTINLIAKTKKLVCNADFTACTKHLDFQLAAVDGFNGD